MCKYHKKCEHFRKNSFTCTHGGGSYCGKYEKVNQREKLNIKDLNQEIYELSRQLSKFEKDPKTCELIEKNISSLLNLKVMLQKEEKILNISNKPEVEIS